MAAIIWVFSVMTACTVGEQDPDQPERHTFMAPAEGRPLVAAHRGGSRLAPENTIAAFDSAVALGVDILEMDVLMTADSVLVLNHDLTIDRTSDGSGGVYDLTLADLQAFNFGYHFRDAAGQYPYRDRPVRIATLEEVLQRYPDQLMILEIKNSGPTGNRAAREVYQLLERYAMTGKVCVFSFDHTVMAHYYHQNGADHYTGASLGEVLTFAADAASGMHVKKQYPYEVFALPLDFQGIPLQTDDPLFIETAHTSGIAVYYWTINDRETMEELLSGPVDGIITDRPDLLLEILAEMD